MCGYGLQLKTQAILDSYLFLPIYPPKTGNDDLQIDESSRDIFLGMVNMVNNQPAAELDHVKTYGWFSPF